MEYYDPRNDLIKDWENEMKKELLQRELWTRPEHKEKKNEIDSM